MGTDPLPLDSPRWEELSHAYGDAADTARLLRQLHERPNTDLADPAWDELCGSICHQGSVYPASFAALPHLATIAERAKPGLSLSAINLMTAIVVSDDRREEPPPDLLPAFDAAVARLEPLAIRALAGAEDLRAVAICCGAIMAGRGFRSAAAHVFDPLEGDHYVCPNCEEQLG